MEFYKYLFKREREPGRQRIWNFGSFLCNINTPGFVHGKCTSVLQGNHCLCPCSFQFSSSLLLDSQECCLSCHTKTCYWLLLCLALKGGLLWAHWCFLGHSLAFTRITWTTEVSYLFAADAVAIIFAVFSSIQNSYFTFKDFNAETIDTFNFFSFVALICQIEWFLFLYFLFG